MAKKLKCWRKVDKDTFRKKGTDKEVNIERSGRRKGNFFVFKSKGNDPDTVRLISNEKGFKNKSQSLKFVKSYMRKHDKC